MFGRSLSSGARYIAQQIEGLHCKKLTVHRKEGKNTTSGGPENYSRGAAQETELGQGRELNDLDSAFRVRGSCKLQDSLRSQRDNKDM